MSRTAAPLQWAEGWPFILAMLAGALLLAWWKTGVPAEPPCSASDASKPFTIALPDGSQVRADGAAYDPDTKTFYFVNGTEVFCDGFE